jgi:RNA polymerase sigma-70 factor (ECF subfamily)
MVEMNDITLERCAPSEEAISDNLWSDDARLLALAKAGNEDAYTELIKQASPVALRAVRRILRTEADAEDALQEALIRSYLKLYTFDGRAKFSTWFTRIAINSALMIRRRYRRSHEVSLAGDQETNDWMISSLVDPHLSPFERLQICQEYEVLHHVIDSLPFSLREGLLVRCSDDASIRDIAVQLHLSVSATKTRLLRARRAVIAAANARLMPSWGSARRASRKQR